MAISTGGPTKQGAQAPVEQVPAPTPPPKSTAPAPTPAPLPSNPVTNPPTPTSSPNQPITPPTQSMPPVTGGGTTTTLGSVSGPFQPYGGESIDSSSSGQGSSPGSTPSGLSWAAVENYWIQAGGNPQAASMAAAIADASSGLNAQSSRTNPDGSTSVGLWLIPANGSPPGSTDPLANARAAVQLSQNGTDWSQWCVAWSDNNCGENNGTYLGAGSNALMSLQGQQPGASYNVFGSTPAGSGVGASSATSAAGTLTPASSSSSLPLLIGGLVIGVIVIIVLTNRKKRGQDTQTQTQVEV